MPLPQIVPTDANCAACGGGDDEAGNEILLCDGDGCVAAYHLQCLTPPLFEIPDGDWFCTACEADREEQEAAHLDELCSSVDGDATDLAALGMCCLLPVLLAPVESRSRANYITQRVETRVDVHV